MGYMIAAKKFYDTCGCSFPTSKEQDLIFEKLVRANMEVGETVELSKLRQIEKLSEREREAMAIAFHKSYLNKLGLEYIDEDISDEDTVEEVKKETKEVNNIANDIIKVRYIRANARGLFNKRNKTVTILKGSKVGEGYEDKRGLIKKAIQLREKYVQDGIITQNIGGLSPTTAGQVVYGNACNGWTDWIDEEDNPIYRYKLKKLEYHITNEKSAKGLYDKSKNIMILLAGSYINDSSVDTQSRAIRGLYRLYIEDNKIIKDIPDMPLDKATILVCGHKEEPTIWEENQEEEVQEVEPEIDEIEAEQSQADLEVEQEIDIEEQPQVETQTIQNKDKDVNTEKELTPEEHIVKGLSELIKGKDKEKEQNLLVDLSDNTKEFLKGLFGSVVDKYIAAITKPQKQPIPTVGKETEPYTPEDFNRDVIGYNFDQLYTQLERKCNLLMLGVPGTSKSFNAMKFAQAICGYKNTNRILRVQFHDQYKYENFIMNKQQNAFGVFDYTPGIFVQFCRMAELDPTRPYPVVLEELAKGNANSIIGEITTLMEYGHRGEKMPLPNGEMFSIPPNVPIIATANSQQTFNIELDESQKQRYAIKRIEPLWEDEEFIERVYSNNIHIKDEIRKLRNIVISMNKEVRDNEILGENKILGHRVLIILNTAGKSRNKSLQMLMDTIEDIIELIKTSLADDPSVLRKWVRKFKELQNEIYKVQED